jgi:hypothetical protein
VWRKGLLIARLQLRLPASTQTTTLVPSLSTPTSKHVLNAQVSIRAPCCQKWYDVSVAFRLLLSTGCSLTVLVTGSSAPPQCPECHAEKEDHNLKRTMEMHFICKKVLSLFRVLVIPLAAL